MDKSTQGSKQADDIDELPEAKLLRADQLGRLGNPEVKAWRFSDLAQDEVKEQQELRADVLARVRKEIAPEVSRQTTLLKKEAFEKAHKEGYDAGFQQGLAQGKQQAYDEAVLKADAELKPQVERLLSLLDFLKSPYGAIEQQVFKSFADLAVALAEKLVKAQIAESTDWVIKAVQDSVDLLPEDTATLEIELNPQDIDLVSKYQADFDKTWVLKRNPDMPLGSCRVKQNFSVVENIWQKRLAELLDETHQVIKHAVQPSPDSNANNPLG
ncbi:FliH/SctL family protein [Thiosulfativibrio zosterae]|uniref:FliH/SctL family protein n=1 Tax=Thiosulfativibrio zosterae TaxID=2675053 RepID=UPI0015679A18|nr:FliH/SctL family protein [Thiosulfativibrio zosterae]